MKKIIPALVWYRPFEPFAYPFIRFCCGFVFVTHGVNRLFYGGSAAEAGISNNQLLPVLLGLFEAVGGLMLAVGFLTRTIAALFAVLWVVIATDVPVELGKSWLMLSASLHYPAMVAAMCAAFALSGSGAYSIDDAFAKERQLGVHSDRIVKIGCLIIRVTVALVFLQGGIEKFFLGGAGRIAAGNITKLGLAYPQGWAWTVASLDLFGSILLGLGLFVRPIAFAFLIEVLVISFGIAAARGFFWTSNGAEITLLMAACFIGFIFSGGGRYSLDRVIGYEF